MKSRTDTIAAVLRRPRLRRPALAHELAERLVQGLGARSTVTEWTATVPQLAEAIDAALQEQEREEKDTPAEGNRPPAGAADTARAEILRTLMDAGYNEPAAGELLALAFREPHGQSPDVGSLQSLAGGHALLVEYGADEALGSCQCGRRLGRITPGKPLDALAVPWERHACTELTTASNGVS
ncbi:hypothetical protein ACFVOR_16280 [Streptomyces sp. NPDC057837]|uniref:hypothetical protein n=1 Tax=Streptomyces sp. NPDC057837 TaxID=3346260 RepID=UPI0036B5263A